MLNRRLVTLAMAFVFFASACGGGSTGDATSGDDSSGDGGDGSTNADEYVYESPLGDFLGWNNGVDFDEEAAQAQAQEQERLVQEQIAVCMRGEGFEYKPVDYGGANFGVAVDDSSLPEAEQWGSRAWTEKYGFGITTQRFPQAQVGPDLVGYDDSLYGGPGEEFVDPNQEYIDGLTPDEQTAYFAALYGAQDQYPVFPWEEEGRDPTDAEIEEMNRFWEEEYVPTGCQNEAYESTNGNNGFGPDEEIYGQWEEEFGTLMEDMYERVQASPELIEYRAGVEACVSEKGFDYLVQDEMYTYFENKMQEIGLDYQDPLEGVDTTDFTDEDFQAAYEEYQNKPLPADQLALLAEVQTEEVGMAVAGFDCGGGWENESKVTDRVRIELERQFLIDNADGLAEYEGVFGQN